VDFKYNKKIDIAIPTSKIESSVREQLIIVDIDLKKSTQIHKRRFGQHYMIDKA
jgi:hypothetical protein